jgi:hypothetical protein
MHRIEAAIEAVPDMRLKSPSPKKPDTARPDNKMAVGIPYNSKNSFGSSGRRNKSSIFPETRKPPEMLMNDKRVAKAPIQ